MANKTLLNATNEIFKRVGLIAGDAALLTTLTDSPRQRAIDQAVQVVNEGITELYSVADIALPNEQAEGTITLVTATRAYSLNAALVMLRWPLIDKTNNQYIREYPGGYAAMLIADPEQDDTGLPQFGAIRPTDGLLHMDRAPEAADNGKIYTYQYDKSLLLTAAANEVPFNDTIFGQMVPAWVQLWKREMRNEFDGELYRKSMGAASRLLKQKPARTSWSPR